VFSFFSFEYRGNQRENKTHHQKDRLKVTRKPSVSLPRRKDFAK
jgi:hypothetical protein